MTQNGGPTSGPELLPCCGRCADRCSWSREAGSGPGDLCTALGSFNCHNVRLVVRLSKVVTLGLISGLQVSPAFKVGARRQPGQQPRLGRAKVGGGGCQPNVHPHSCPLRGSLRLMGEGGQKVPRVLSPHLLGPWRASCNRNKASLWDPSTHQT